MVISKKTHKEDYAAVCQCVSYRHFRHPDWFGLLVADLVFQTLVPSVRGGLQVDARWKEKHQEPVQNEKHCLALLRRVFFFFLREFREFCGVYQRKGDCSLSSV